MSLSLLFKEVVDFIKEGIAPSRCVECGRLGVWLCSACSGKVLFLKQQNCYRCGRLMPQGRTCTRCRAHTHLAGVTVATHFGIGPIRQLVHELKYGGLRELAGILGEALVTSARYNQLDGFVIVPVPLHPQRLAKRGFNQAELLAGVLARKLGWPQEQLLVRSKNTTTQTNLTREQRRANVQGAFACKNNLEGKKVLLIDDVMTTGATLEECAMVLKRAGAKQIWALVVARG